jgi:hypothetical protein
VSEVSFTGGARVGWVNASWPFARLTTSAAQLTLSTLGKFEFSPQQVVSLELHGSIPVLSSGIRIVHNRTDYPERIIFWCIGSREKILAQIHGAGFRAQGEPASSPRATGFPLRWSLVVLFVVLWNALFLWDGSFVEHRSSAPGPSALLALLLTFSLCWGIRRSAWLQGIVLREGHRVGEIKSFLVLLQIVSGALFVGFTAAWLGTAHAG